MPGPKPRPLADRFWEKVDRGEECWTWKPEFSRNPGGYGMFTPRHGARVGAHRISWELANGPIPPGMFVLHHCDNPPCVRPDHLWLGTHLDNMADMKAKGRSHSGRPGRVRDSATGRYIA